MLNNMIDTSTTQAWKNPAVRRSMSASQQSKLLNHPAGSSKLEHDIINGKPEVITAMGTAICTPCPPQHCL